MLQINSDLATLVLRSSIREVDVLAVVYGGFRRFHEKGRRGRSQVSLWSRSADSTVAERICERLLLLDDLEEYTNSSECTRIRSATVESAERDYNQLFFLNSSVIGQFL